MVAGYSIVVIEFFQVFEPCLYSSQLLFDRCEFFPGDTGFFQFVYFLFQWSEQGASVPENKAKIGNGNGSKSVTDDFQKRIHLFESFVHIFTQFLEPSVYILEPSVYILKSFVNRFKPVVSGFHEGFQSCFQANKSFSVCLSETGAGVRPVSSETEVR